MKEEGVEERRWLQISKLVMSIPTFIGNMIPTSFLVDTLRGSKIRCVHISIDGLHVQVQVVVPSDVATWLVAVDGDETAESF